MCCGEKGVVGLEGSVVVGEMLELGSAGATTLIRGQAPNATRRGAT